MKKNYVRLFAVLMCAVMLFSLVPAKANAVALDGMQMKQMKSISVDQYGEYTFTNANELAELRIMAE